MEFKQFLDRKTDTITYGMQLDQQEIITKSEDLRIAKFVGLTVNLIDKQGDDISENEVRKAAYDFIQTPMDVDFEHKVPLTKGDIRIVESFLLEDFDHIVTPSGLRPDLRDPRAMTEFLNTLKTGWGVELNSEDYKHEVAKSTGFIGKKVTKGSWILAFEFVNQGLWDYFKSGNIIGISVQGPATKIPYIKDGTNG